jgi:hypothetical protein
MKMTNVIEKLVAAGVMQDNDANIRYWAAQCEKEELTPEQVLKGVDHIVRSGQSYVHLGMVIKATRDMMTADRREEANQQQERQWREERKKSTGMPHACKVALEYLEISNPTVLDAKKVVNAHLEEENKHPVGSELRRLWRTARETWEIKYDKKRSELGLG